MAAYYIYDAIIEINDNIFKNGKLDHKCDWYIFKNILNYGFSDTYRKDLYTIIAMFMNDPNFIDDNLDKCLEEVRYDDEDDHIVYELYDLIKSRIKIKNPSFRDEEDD